MKRWYVLLGAFLLAAVSLSAQDADMKAADTQTGTPAAGQAVPSACATPGYQLYPNAFGLSFVSNFLGGLTYQRWFDNGFGFSITAGGSLREKNRYINYMRSNYTVQLGVQKILSWSELVKGASEVGIYCTALAAHQGYQIRKTDNTAGGLEFKSGLGLGLGTEFLFANRVSLTFEALVVGAYPLDVGIDGGMGLKFRF